MFSNFRERAWEDDGHDISPEQTEFAKGLRIPFLTSPYPRWGYITGIVVEDGPAWSAIVPTDEEVQLIAELLKEYNDRWYRPSFIDAMRELAPYDIDDHANLAYFKKNADGGWNFRKRTWSGIEWGPSFTNRVHTLEEVIEAVRNR